MRVYHTQCNPDFKIWQIKATAFKKYAVCSEGSTGTSGIMLS